MYDPQLLGVFLLGSLVLLLTPGPAVLFVVTRSLQHGRTAGLISTLGLGSGALVHVVAAVVGLSALVTESSLAFNTIKLVGAAYLVFLGIKALRSPNTLAATFQRDLAVRSSSGSRHFLDALRRPISVWASPQRSPGGAPTRLRTIGP